jgi:hypothetical protein
MNPQFEPRRVSTFSRLPPLAGRATITMLFMGSNNLLLQFLATERDKTDQRRQTLASKSPTLCFVKEWAPAVSREVYPASLLQAF